MSERIPNLAAGPGTRTSIGVVNGSVNPRYSPASSTVPLVHGLVSASGSGPRRARK